MAQRGIVVAGLNSQSGKTTLTLGLLHAIAQAGHDVAAAKSGPDYIDCALLSAACPVPAVNLDAQAMSEDTLRHLATRQTGSFLVVEGAMGLFDGTDNEGGSTASLARILGLPIVLVIDARHQAQTAAAIAAGLAAQLPDESPLAGVVLNHVASPRHEALVAAALAKRGVAMFGALPADAGVVIPSRHLGLVQAGELRETGKLEPVIKAAAKLVASHIDADALVQRRQTCIQAPVNAPPSPPPPGQRIAVARDAAFSFCYEHTLMWWREGGAKILPFSPLGDEAPEADADFVFLPGGYPELHLERLAGASKFMKGLREAAGRGVRIYGECGGYMVLGTSIIDENGASFAMAGLLDLETSFAKRRLHLGYRRLVARHEFWPGMGSRPGTSFTTRQPCVKRVIHYSMSPTRRGRNWRRRGWFRGRCAVPICISLRSGGQRHAAR